MLSASCKLISSTLALQLLSPLQSLNAWKRLELPPVHTQTLELESVGTDTRLGELPHETQNRTTPDMKYKAFCFMAFLIYA